MSKLSSKKLLISQYPRSQTNTNKKWTTKYCSLFRVVFTYDHGEDGHCTFSQRADSDSLLHRQKREEALLSILRKCFML